MSLADYYRTLGLRTGASFADVKASYRKLARKYHPDVNPGDQWAKERFIQVTQAYDALAEVLQPEETLTQLANQRPQPQPPQPPEPDRQAPDEIIQPDAPPVRVNPSLSDLEQRLKRDSYAQLQDLLKKQKYPRAIALVEGLAQRITHDSEVRQWQAIAYQRWGRHLITEGKCDKARVYLNKALKTDPLNKSLWAEINRDFQQLEQQSRGSSYQE
jgi:tetratricopeptide (TPR) repeat protein